MSLRHSLVDGEQGAFDGNCGGLFPARRDQQTPFEGRRLPLEETARPSHRAPSRREPMGMSRPTVFRK